MPGLARIEHSIHQIHSELMAPAETHSALYEPSLCLGLYTLSSCMHDDLMGQCSPAGSCVCA